MFNDSMITGYGQLVCCSILTVDGLEMNSSGIGVGYSQMRRLLSILLLLVLALGPAIAAVPAQALASGWTGERDEASLPACCRRNGVHHCGMNADGHSSAISVKSETTVSPTCTCPCFPGSAASVVAPVDALAADGAAELAVVTRWHALQSGVDAARFNQQRTWPKRGPPVSQSF